MTEPTKLSKAHRKELERLQRQVGELLQERTRQPKGVVSVRRLSEGWFEFDGRVRRPHIKRRLFRLVPSTRGERRIVDRIRVGELHSV